MKQIKALFEVTRGLHLFDGMEVIEFELVEKLNVPVHWNDLQNNPAADLLIVARHDENVAKVLLLQEHKKDWANLYRILEVIGDDIGGDEKIEKAGWATTKEINTFTGSANNPILTGDDARHGSQKGIPTRRIMNL